MTCVRAVFCSLSLFSLASFFLALSWYCLLHHILSWILLKTFPSYRLHSHSKCCFFFFPFLEEYVGRWLDTPKPNVIHFLWYHILERYILVWFKFNCACYMNVCVYGAEEDQRASVCVCVCTCIKRWRQLVLKELKDFLYQMTNTVQLS